MGGIVGLSGYSGEFLWPALKAALEREAAKKTLAAAAAKAAGSASGWVSSSGMQGPASTALARYVAPTAARSLASTLGYEGLGLSSLGSALPVVGAGSLAIGAIQDAADPLNKAVQEGSTLYGYQTTNNRPNPDYKPSIAVSPKNRPFLWDMGSPATTRLEENGLGIFGPLYKPQATLEGPSLSKAQGVPIAPKAPSVAPAASHGAAPVSTSSGQTDAEVETEYPFSEGGEMAGPPTSQIATGPRLSAAPVQPVPIGSTPPSRASYEGIYGPAAKVDPWKELGNVMGASLARGPMKEYFLAQNLQEQKRVEEENLRRQAMIQQQMMADKEFTQRGQTMDEAMAHQKELYEFQNQIGQQDPLYKMKLQEAQARMAYMPVELQIEFMSKIALAKAAFDKSDTAGARMALDAAIHLADFQRGDVVAGMSPEVQGMRMEGGRALQGILRGGGGYNLSEAPVGGTAAIPPKAAAAIQQALALPTLAERKAKLAEIAQLAIQRGETAVNTEALRIAGTLK